MSPDRREGHGPKKPKEAEAALAAPPIPVGPPPEGLEASEFLKLPLPGELIRGAAESGFLRLSPIQERVIPELLNGKNVVARTKAGAGRTVAYLLPALARIRKPGLCQVLVLAPTRTLAAQIAKDARKLATHVPLVTVACLDGARKGSAEQDDLAAGPTMVVGLPERLAEHSDRGNLAIDAVEVLVFDMADRITPSGLSDAETVLLRTPQRRLTVAFAEEIPDHLDAFLERHLRGAVQVDPEGAAGTPDQAFYSVPAEHRLDALEALVSSEHPEGGVVLVRDKFVSDRVAERLKGRDGGARAIHSGVPETKRARMLKDFQAGRFTWLVASDNAAKDIRLDRVRYLVNYDVPETPDEYARRLAWVAPLGKAAQVRTLVAPDQAALLPALASVASKPPKAVPLPGFVPPAPPQERIPRRLQGGKAQDRESWRPTWAGGRHPSKGGKRG